MAVSMPDQIVYANLVSTQAIKTAVLADVNFEIGELEFQFQTKKRAYERIGERRAKAQSDVATATPRIAELNTAIGFLPDGTIKTDLIEERDTLIRRKANAELVLQNSGEGATILAFKELEALFGQINALGVSLTDIGGIMPAN